MISVESDFPAFLEQVRAGTPSAVDRFVDCFGPLVLQSIRKRLNYRIRSQFDSADFLQGVWASVFRRPECLTEVTAPNDVLRLLRRIAQNKVLDETRRVFQARKRAEGVEAPFAACEEHLQSTPQFTDQRQPRPSEICHARERWHQLLAAPPEHLRQIPVLRCLGATAEEIAETLGLHARTVRKVIEKLEEVAQRFR